MRFVVVAVAGIIVGTPGAAQSPIKFPAEGTPVRAKTDYGIVSGFVQRRSDDSLWITDADLKLRAFRRREIWEMSTYGTQYGRGAKRGGLIGGALGLATMGAAIWYDSHTKEESFIPLSVLAAPYALSMPLLGAGIGVIFAPQGWSKPKIY